MAALESESEGIEAFVTNKTTLRVLKKRESEVRAKRPSAERVSVLLLLLHAARAFACRRSSSTCSPTHEAGVTTAGAISGFSRGHVLSPQKLCSKPMEAG